MCMEKTIDVIIPVYRPGKEFQELLRRLLCQSILPEHIFILQTLEEGEAMLKPQDERIQVFPIAKKDFDHGRTRAYGVSLSKADYVLLMTQDAMPADRELLFRLRKGFEGEKVGIVYGRQLAREDADITERLTRLYNYPAQSRMQTKKDIETLGIKAYFCSDVCAMYDRRLYGELGGFSHPTVFNEDMIMASKVIQSAYAVYYAADARVIHSHAYTCMQQLRRNFDLGVSQKQYSEVFETVSSEKEGAGFARQTILTLCRKGHPFKAVYFAWQCAFRLVGYRLGKRYDRLPDSVVGFCTMSPGYWKNRE